MNGEITSIKVNGAAQPIENHSVNIETKSIVTDTDSNKSYFIKLKLVNGKPVIEYDENTVI